MCRGYCYAICFEICKALKKGGIEFLAIKKFSPHDDEEDDANIRLRNCTKSTKLKFISLLVLMKLVTNLMKNLEKNKSLNLQSGLLIMTALCFGKMTRRKLKHFTTGYTTFNQPCFYV